MAALIKINKQALLVSTFMSFFAISFATLPIIEKEISIRVLTKKPKKLEKVNRVGLYTKKFTFPRAYLDLAPSNLNKKDKRNFIRGGLTEPVNLSILIC